MFNDIYFLSNIASLKINEKKSPQQIKELREKKLKKIVKHAYRNSPFYRNLYYNHGVKFEDIDNIAIENLPSVTKDIVMKNLEQIVTRKDIDVKKALAFAYENKNPEILFNGKYQIVHSSGSSGKPAIFIYSISEMTKAFSCSSRMHLFEIGKKNKAAYYAGIDARFGGVSLVLHGKMGILKGMYDICLIDMNEPLEKTIEKLNEFQPDILIGYGTGLTILAKCQQEGRLRISPRVIENGGEGLSDADYLLIKSTFNVPIVNMYAASECYYIGIGKDEYDGIYLMDDFNYIEIMEDHILVTNLYNYTQPIIRYRINDRLFLKEDRKKILPFRLVDNIVGREEISLWFRNEKGVMDYIHPIVFTSYCFEGIEKFQILLKSENSFEFLAVISDSNMKQKAFQDVKTILDEVLRKKAMKNVTYIMESIECPIIDKNTRKFKMIIKDY